MINPPASTPDPGRSTTDDHSQPKLASPIHTFSLYISAFCLFFVYGSILIGTLLPPEIMNPAWRLRVASTLINSAFLPLLGLGILHISIALSSEGGFFGHKHLKDIWTNLRRWSVLVALGFLLLVPLQTTAA